MLVLTPPHREANAATVAVYGALTLGLLLGVHRYVQGSKSIKGPKARHIQKPASTLPVLGNLFDLAKEERFHDWMLEQAVHFKGEPWLMTIPGATPTVMLYTPEAIEDLMRQNDVLIRGKFQSERIEHIVGTGILASDGERWYRQRKVAATFFTSKTLRAFVTQSMKKNLRKVEQVLESKMKNRQQAELRHLFLGFTMQTFVEMGVGTELDWIGRDEPHPFEEAFDLGSLLSLRRIRVPEFVWKLERWLNVGQERVLAEYCNTMRTWMNEVVQEGLKQAMAKQNLTSSDTSNNVKSVVELFVEQSSEVDGLRPEDLVDFIMAFVVAARDTTALTLAWLFFELGRNPAIEQAIRKEMTDKLNVDKDTYLTPDHIRSLTMLEATIKETLRFHPVAPFFMREAAEDAFVCGDILVKKGQTVGLSMYSINRNPTTWGPDAGEFKPQRWIDKKTGTILNIPPTQFFSFGAGPRMCVGMNLAMQQLRVVTANLLHKYRFDIDPSNDGTYVAGLTLNMKFPLLATVARV